MGNCVPKAISRSLVALAWLNVALHLAGLVLAATALRPGSPLVPLGERLAYLDGDPLGWRIAWSVWMLCALGLVSFFAAVTWQVEALEPPRLARLGLTIALVGAGFDLSCDIVFLVAFPPLAAGSTQLFLIVEGVTQFVSLFVANGAYSVGILLMALQLRQRVGRWTSGVGYAVAAFGLLLAAAGVTGVPWHAYASGPAIGLFCVWVVLVARELER